MNMETINSNSDSATIITAINQNFTDLNNEINKVVPNLYDIDLYNIQGQITSGNATELYNRLPYNSGLIWYLPNDSEGNQISYTFLNETYYNGDYILKLGNDIPLKIPHDIKGTYIPNFSPVTNISNEVTITYTYSAGAADSNTKQIFTMGDNGENRNFSIIHLSQNLTESSFSTAATVSTYLPVVEFFLNSVSDSSGFTSFSDPILIDYYEKYSGYWTVYLPDGCPECVAIIR